MCLIFVITLTNNWHIQSIDLVLTYPQVDIKTDVYVTSQLPIYDLLNTYDRFAEV